MAVVYLKVLSKHLHKGSEENHEECQLSGFLPVVL
jgi:hypothetical protein